MFRVSQLFVFGLIFWQAVGAFAQDVQIQFPQEGQLVRGQITVRYSGIPDGGYAVIKVDGNFTTATSQSTFVLNTFPPTFSGDGTHRVTVVGINAGGKNVGEKTVSFEVANNRVEAGGESVRLTHYVDAMRLDDEVQRYRLFAESNGVVDAGETSAEVSEEWIPAPLDWQVSALMRRIVRDVGMYSDNKADGGTSANIRTVVQEAYQHQRQSETSGADGAAPPAPPRRRKQQSGPTKAPWKVEWEPAPEVGQYFVKMIEPSGKEINATRKAPTIAIADLLPTFPEADVRPGSTWETRMTFIGDLSSRQPVNVSVPITFTSFENVQTLGGANQRTAKLESRFRMPEDLAKKMAINLILQGGGAEAGGTETGAGGAGVTGAVADKTWKGLPAEELELFMESITSVRTNASRVLWFDIENHRVLRSEDTINTSFAYEPLEGGEGGGELGGEAAAAEPLKISYNLVVTTWLDDSDPAATAKFNGGSGTAHGRDNVTDPTIERSKP